jgi:PAS domain S-box-containing protein
MQSAKSKTNQPHTERPKTAQLAIVPPAAGQRSIGQVSSEAQRLLSAIVESSEDAIISKSLRGIVTSWNAAAERVFGYKAEEMIGRPITTIIPPELQHDEERILATIASGRRIEHFETVRIAKNGEHVDVSLTISPIKDESGRIVGAAKIARDITQQRKTEQALHTTERLASVGRLAATVAHEINNPLEAVVNLVYLARHSDSWGEVRQYLAAADEELVRISHLTKQTLGFYRDSQAAIPIRLGAMVRSLAAVFSSRVRNKEIDFQSEIRQDPEIVGIPGELRQLIANLISNSIDAVPRRGHVRIRLSRAREKRADGREGIRLTVADSGPGIPPAVRARLFEPFFTTKKDIGTGLGLWVCKGIVEKHHGQISVKSYRQNGNSGTVFSVFLPMSASTLQMQEARQVAL